MNKIIYIFFIIPVFCFGQIAHFGAEGYGKNTTGGRNGTIYHVTNKNNTGVGSLRYGLETLSGSRAIVFDVSGYIDSPTPIKIRDGFGNVSIVGQTSPEGICIRGASLYISDDNVSVRHIKVRPGKDAFDPSGLPPTDPDYEPDDGIRIIGFGGQGGINNVMIDHVEVSWAADGIIDIGGATTVEIKNISVTNSILSENISKGYGMLLLPAFNVTLKNNIWYSLDSRIPFMSSADAQGGEFINNYCYYIGGASAFRRGNKVDFINNDYDTGALTRSFDVFRMEAEFNTNIANTRIYLEGNLDSGLDADSSINATALPYLETTAFHSSGASIMATALVKDSLVDHVGTKFYDASTIRVMNHIKNGTGAIIRDEAEVGGYPALSTTARLASEDSDSDDMLDVAEIAIWGDITTTNNLWALTNGTSISAYDDFPNVEKVWAWQSSPVIPTGIGSVIGVTPQSGKKTGDAFYFGG